MNKRFTTFGIAGGDKRQLYLAQALVNSGYRVMLGGFDKLSVNKDFCSTDVSSVIKESDAVIFPLPSVRTDGSINTPFSAFNIRLSEKDTDYLLQKPVLVSMKDKLLRMYPQLRNAQVYDYSARESFAVLNALPTAEGAIECAMREYEGTIADSRCLVAGFGRIGKILAQKLVALGADVTVSARKAEDFAYIRAYGYKSVNTEELSSLYDYDIVFNTVPALIFTENLLSEADRSTIIIDLASLPGGVDFEAADRLNITAVRALSLPGKCAPKTAAEIIRKTLLDIIEEVYG